MLNDNVVEMEISWSTGEENEFAVVINHHVAVFYTHIRVCGLEAAAGFSPQLALIPVHHSPLDRQVRALLSTPRDRSAGAFQKVEENLSTFFLFPCLKNLVTMATWHYAGQEPRRLILSSAW